MKTRLIQAKHTRLADELFRRHLNEGRDLFAIDGTKLVYFSELPICQLRGDTMQEIGSGEKYRVEVDVSENRVYSWFKGDLLTNSDLKGLLESIRTACEMLKPGLTSYADFTEVKLLAMSDVMQEAQRILASSGLRRSATVWAEESFAKLLVDSQAQKIKEGSFAEKRRAFKNRAEAEAWLDET